MELLMRKCFKNVKKINGRYLDPCFSPFIPPARMPLPDNSRVKRSPFDICQHLIASHLFSCGLLCSISEPYINGVSPFNLLSSKLQAPIPMTNSDPPLLDQYRTLSSHSARCDIEPRSRHVAAEECWLPLIDLSGLSCRDKTVRRACVAAICRASSEWGFFQVVNHGISPRLVEKMRREQVRLFETPFDRKASCGVLNNSYRWGSPRATCPKHLSWSEAFHVPLTKVSDDACYGEFLSLREVMPEFAAAMSKLARLLAGVLTENLGHGKEVIDDLCDESNCFLRLNHYPACPISPEITGLVPHTDSDFLTILCQDHVGGLQLMKDSKWLTVKPNQEALIVNIGDLFQAWSNDVYKSVEHKVLTNAKMDRYSVAYFLCPSYDSSIGSFGEPSIYRKFTFREYRDQVQEDVRKTGYKVGLPRFLVNGTVDSVARSKESKAKVYIQQASSSTVR